jgi:hypothetical protein
MDEEGPLTSPSVIVDPKSDKDFAALVQRLLRAGARSPSRLQAELRATHPEAVVRPRGLSSEPLTWYVYRDGHWIGVPRSTGP